jgi:hypothetical protein
MYNHVRKEAYVRTPTNSNHVIYIPVWPSCLIAVWMLHIIKLYLNCNCNFRACYNAKVEVVKQLVALTGPDSLIKENLFGETPLHSACTNGRSLELIKFFVQSCEKRSICKNTNKLQPCHIHTCVAIFSLTVHIDSWLFQ